MANISTISGTGVCKKCGTQKTTVNDNPPICLNCDMPENKPSGLVVRVNDPGHAAMLDIEAGKKFSNTEQVKPNDNADYIYLKLTLDELETEGLQDLVVSRIIEALDELPCPKMKDAKRIMKIQDKLEAK